LLHPFGDSNKSIETGVQSSLQPVYAMSTAGNRFNSVAGGAGTSATITGGTIAEARTFDIGNNSSITLGRWNSPSNLLLTGLGSFNGPAATTHFAYGSSGYPPYLSDVLTGTVSYQRIGATSPTNDGGVSGTLTTATLDVNFSARLQQPRPTRQRQHHG